MALNPPLSHWPGRVAWVIGASSGIGRATAAALHGQGAHVIVSARHAGPLQEFVSAHPGSLALPLDVTDADATRAAFQTACRHGAQPLDLVMYCAGHYRATSVHDYRLEEMSQHLAINYGGALNLLAAALPDMLSHQRGHLSLVGSVAGYRGLPRSLAYGPTKAALINLAETLYLELSPQGLGVSIINPGFVETPLTAQNTFRMPALITPQEAAGHILEGWAAGRFEMNFPRRFTRWMRLLRLLPDRAYFAAVRRFTQT